MEINSHCSRLPAPSASSGRPQFRGGKKGASGKELPHLVPLILPPGRRQVLLSGPCESQGGIPAHFRTITTSLQRNAHAPRFAEHERVSQCSLVSANQTPLNDNGSGAAVSIAPASGTMEDVKERIWEAQQRDSPDPMPDLRPALPGFSAYPGYDSGAHLRTALGTFTRNSP